MTNESNHPENQLLDQGYVYQNNTTGAVSPAPLTTRQLCRILCPTSGVVLQHVTPETQVLGVKEDGTFDSVGWRSAKTVPVLQEACAQWYYANKDGTQGPLSCRSMAELIDKKEITAQQKVWSTHLDSWASIEEMPELSAALHAFQVNVPVEIAKDGYDDSTMTFDAKTDANEPQEKGLQDELEAFLSTTAKLGPQDDDGEDDEGYESDGGTQYVKDQRTGNWIHSALAPPKAAATSNNKRAREEEPSKKPQVPTKKRKKPKFSAKNAKCWVYVQDLPIDTDEEEVSKFFSKVGIIELDPETQRPKIKLYRHREGAEAGKLKGDGSICYARPESVELALQLLDEAPFRPSVSAQDDSLPIRVSRAKFEQHGDKFEKKAPVSNAKRKVAKLAAIQAIDWDEGDNGRITGGRKGLRIIVLKHMFQPSDLLKDEDAVLAKLEHDVHTECEQWGEVEKITVFSKHPEGIVVVKFAQPAAASTAVTEFHGRDHNGKQIEAIFWDGVTDFTVRDEEKEKIESEKRQEEFGKWLESQALPEEFRLNVEGKS